MVDSIFPHGAGGLSQQKILADFWKSSALITSACASASGWGSVVHDAKIAAGPCVMAYVWDRASDWLWVCGVPPEKFNENARKAARAKSQVVDGIRSALGELICRVAKGDPIPGPNWEKDLASLVSAYAGTTQTWALADEMRAGGHFIVLFYRQPGSQVGMLRPFARSGAVSSREVMPIETLRGVICQVEQMDRARHPEWFA